MDNVINIKPKQQPCFICSCKVGSGSTIEVKGLHKLICLSCIFKVMDSASKLMFSMNEDILGRV